MAQRKRKQKRKHEAKWKEREREREREIGAAEEARIEKEREVPPRRFEEMI
jgi:hypothetical protein